MKWFRARTRSLSGGCSELNELPKISHPRAVGEHRRQLVGREKRKVPEKHRTSY